MKARSAVGVVDGFLKPLSLKTRAVMSPVLHTVVIAAMR